MTSTADNDAQARSEMNRMYKWTRHVYDASRKYYLLGRDRLIVQLAPKDNEIVCEVGCGTARNLIKMREYYPEARLYGLDASDEMLKTAQKALDKAGVDICIKQAYAQNFDPESLFALKEPISKFVFSYSLSIIPPWREAIDHALQMLPSGGEIHIVDFGGMNGLPRVFRNFMFWFLEKFHVYYKPEIRTHLESLQQSGLGDLRINEIYKGYSYIAVFKKN